MHGKVRTVLVILNFQIRLFILTNLNKKCQISCQIGTFTMRMTGITMHTCAIEEKWFCTIFDCIYEENYKFAKILFPLIEFACKLLWDSRDFVTQYNFELWLQHQPSISSTFYAHIFCTEVIGTAFF